MITCISKITFIDGQTLYVGNESSYRSDGGDPFFINGDMSSPVSSYSIGDLRVAKYEEIPLTFSINNVSGDYDKYMRGGSLSIPYWQGAIVEMYTGGDDSGPINSGTLEYKGTIPIGGITESIGSINVTVQPVTLQYDLSIGENTINESDYPNAPSFGSSIPLRIGEFTGASFVNENGLSTLKIDSNIIKVNDGSIDNVTVYRFSGGTWSDVTGSSIVDNINGNVTVPVLTADDEFTVACECWPSSFNGPTSFQIVPIIQWILTDLASVPISDIDTSSFNAAFASGDKYDVRRDLQGVTTVYQELSSLALETGFSLYQSRTGQYGLQFFIPTAPVVKETFDNQNRMDEVSIEHDPNRLYANRISMQFDFIGGSPRGAVDSRDTTEISLYGKEVTAAINYNWLYTESSALLSAQRKLFFWSASPEVITFTATFQDENANSYDVFLLDTIQLNYRRLDNQNIYVREVDFIFQNGTMRISGYNLQSIPFVGLWGSGSALKVATSINDAVLTVNYGYNVSVGTLIKIGLDDNGGAGYEVLLNTSNTITISPSINSSQLINTGILPVISDDGVGVWGPSSSTGSWF